MPEERDAFILDSQHGAVTYVKVTCKPAMKGACFIPLLIINNKAFLSFVSLEKDNVLISLYPVTKHERK